MRRQVKKKALAVLMVFAMLVSLFPSVVGAVESDYSHLIVDTATKPSQAGALKVCNVKKEVEKPPHAGVPGKPGHAGQKGKPDHAGKPSNAGPPQKTLCDESGNPIQLRGMSTHGLQWFGEIVNGNAFAALANDWDSNMIRLAMYVGENGYATNPGVKDLVYEGIELAFEHDMYVIVDWHVHAPGDPRADVYSGAYDFFKEIADHYKDHPKFHYIIWELANEPSPNNNGGPGIPNNEEGWQAVKEYAEPLVEMLRERGDNIILVGSPNWSQRPDLAADDPIAAKNIMYSVHFYTGTHQPGDSYPEGTPSSERGNVMSNAKYAMENGVAIFATEWGTSQANGDGGPYLDEADVWLNFLNKNNISWANWSLTNKNETSGSFTPFELGKSDATNLDPGDDQVWSMEELSVSGEYVRARIKGIPYEPIDRTKWSQVVWDFNDGTTQGFGPNGDNPVEELTVSNENHALKLTGLNASNGTVGDDIWGNARISSDGWNPSVSIKGAEEIQIDVIVAEPTTVAIAAIPQSAAENIWWANPVNATVSADDFELQDDGTYKALLTITTEESPALGALGESESGLLSNLVLFVGTELTDEVVLDNISFTGTKIEQEVIHAPKGDAQLPADFEDGTRQGFDWNPESGVKTALTIEEANGSNALSWEFAYPEVKPSDGWASAPRLELWKDGMVRGDHENVTFDLYVNPARATEGAIAINLVFQPPAAGYWAQGGQYTIELSEIEDATVTPDGLYHYDVSIAMPSVGTDVLLRNMVLIFADVDSDFAGRVYIDNVRFE
ncbi:carbohydrate-binding domain-containing protein [Bacillus alkalicellulosilyticus]|uniref:carbohydrate-binding domain-containing protein n=1 Tax=Alkalihalobacterium alkalicellulosilyticum TaxID=1912214 RepID=UPI0009979A8B|nr:carbohydrate-binding domain-containing protein [Bacillus alkalicellulosilyticus]